MREIRSSGSVEGVMSNHDPYSNGQSGNLLLEVRAVSLREVGRTAASGAEVTRSTRRASVPSCSQLALNDRFNSSNSITPQLGNDLRNHVARNCGLPVELSIRSLIDPAHKYC
jgi:hypothetical protein